jgi:hypothetical protein
MTMRAATSLSRTVVTDCVKLKRVGPRAAAGVSIEAASGAVACGTAAGA